jgi:hypothetical protein
MSVTIQGDTRENQERSGDPPWYIKERTDKCVQSYRVIQERRGTHPVRIKENIDK